MSTEIFQYPKQYVASPQLHSGLSGLQQLPRQKLCPPLHPFKEPLLHVPLFVLGVLFDVGLTRRAESNKVSQGCDVVNSSLLPRLLRSLPFVFFFSILWVYFSWDGL